MCGLEFIVYEIFNNYYCLLNQTMRALVLQIIVAELQNYKSANFRSDLKINRIIFKEKIMFVEFERMKFYTLQNNLKHM